MTRLKILGIRGCSAIIFQNTRWGRRSRLDDRDALDAAAWLGVRAAQVTSLRWLLLSSTALSGEGGGRLGFGLSVLLGFPHFFDRLLYEGSEVLVTIFILS